MLLQNKKTALCGLLAYIMFAAFTPFHLRHDAPKGNVSKRKFKKWEQKLASSEKDLKNDWKEDVNFNSFTRENLPVTASNFDSLKLISCFRYRIDSAELFRLSPKGSVETILKLEGAKPMVWAVKDNALICSVYREIKDSSWTNEGGYGFFFPGTGKKIYELLNSGRKVHAIDVFASPSYNKKFNYTGSTKDYIVFYEKGELMSIRQDGYIQPLKEKLLELKENIENRKSSK